MSELTIETIIELFADEAAELGEPRPEAFERAQRALAAHDEQVRSLPIDPAGVQGAEYWRNEYETLLESVQRDRGLPDA